MSCCRNMKTAKSIGKSINRDLVSYLSVQGSDIPEAPVLTAVPKVGIMVKEVRVMPIMTREELDQVPENVPELTDELKKRLEELGEKIRKMTYEERRKGRLEEDRKNGFM